ncbi:CBS domain protein [Branchiibius hedensis]|uniref:CBS domain-containing protein n=1 Tax=Branchiibius hedensis TaxID=672460 RepID=A0A2Y8ZYT7_9MICO|nr:CBS domain-containing protein [Branchiibius hedensis]PWJ26577.1 CBS domain protein [Branchiibius hedensis]SSA35389.1 CBS domain-containing protein [Branchiibius hedensis]
MRVSEILRRKGTDVVTVAPDATISDLVALLHEHHIGAVVVLDADRRLIGIVGERDIVRGLAEHGSAVLAQPVSDLMTTRVETCSPGDNVPDLAERMTSLRIRHLPVTSDDDEPGVLAIVSIGDIVKSRLDQLEHERSQLENYISQ